MTIGTGIIGIVASRLIEKYYRPTIVLTKQGEYYIGSARSINGFDIYKALKKCNFWNNLGVTNTRRAKIARIKTQII